MSLKGYLAKLGFTTAAAGSAVVLAFSAGSDLDAANRTGWYADITTSGSEHLGLVAGGVESARALTTGFDVFGELRVTTDNEAALTLDNSGLTYNPSAVGQDFEISRAGHFIQSRVSSNYASFRFSRSAALRVGATSDGPTRGFLLMEGNHPIHVSIQDTDVGRFFKTQLSIDVATASTSTTTGALVVVGGVGIGDDLHVGGDLTVTGLAGSTGLALSPVEENPGGVLGDSTLWVDSTNDDTLMYGDDPVTASTALVSSYIGFGSFENVLTGVDTFTYDPAVKTLTFHDFQWRQIEGNQEPNLWLGRGGTFDTGTNNGVFIGLNIPNIPNSASNSIWIGNGGTQPTGDRSLTVGRPDFSTARNAINIGSQGGANGQESVCLGYKAHAAHDNSVAIGLEAASAKDNQIVLGNPSNHDEVLIPVTTASTSTTTGALVVAGGVGIGGNLFVGDDSAIAGKLTITPTLGEALQVNSFDDGVVRLNQTSASGYIEQVWALQGTDLISIYSDAREGGPNFWGLYDYESDQDVITYGLTDKAMLIHPTGGLSVVGDLTLLELQSGPDPIVTSATFSRSGINFDPAAEPHWEAAIGVKDVDYITLERDSGANDFVNLHGDVRIGNTTASTSTTTGALVVAGGVGIGGNLSVAGDINLPLTGGVLYMDGGAIKAITLTSGVYSPLVQANGTVTTAPTLSGLFLDTQVSGGLEPPYSFNSPLLSIRAAFNDGGGASGTPGVEVGVRPVGVTGRYELFVQDATLGEDLISIDYYEDALSATLYGHLKVTSSVEVGAADYVYYGDPDTNGSWRFGRDGSNTVFQHREAGSWITKMTVEA